MKIVIVGAKGMLGEDLARVFLDLNPYCLDKDELDITDQSAAEKLIGHLQPDVVINAAACTDVDWCEINRDVALRVNGEAPGYIAKAAKNAGAIFVHYSTDYVFSGAQRANGNFGYKETDEPSNPCNFYGETKLRGEEVVKDIGGKYYLIRTSWLFGRGGGKSNEGPKNFVDKLLYAWKERRKLRVVDDQHGKPTSAWDLAKKTRELILRGENFGVYHIVNEPVTSRYAFAKKLVELYGGDSSTVSPCSSEEFPRLAKRPKSAILLNTKLPSLRSWEDALAEYLSLLRQDKL